MEQLPNMHVCDEAHSSDGQVRYCFKSQLQGKSMLHAKPMAEAKPETTGFAAALLTATLTLAALGGAALAGLQILIG